MPREKETKHKTLQSREHLQDYSLSTVLLQFPFSRGRERSEQVVKVKDDIFPRDGGAEGGGRGENVPVVEWTNVTCFKPAVDAVEVEGVL